MKSSAEGRKGEGEGQKPAVDVRKAQVRGKKLKGRVNNLPQGCEKLS